MNYNRYTADFSKNGVDRLCHDNENKYEYSGIFANAVDFVREKQLLRTELWKRFVTQFKEEDADSEGGWRGEYWGKMMRGACFVYSVTRDSELYDILEATVRDMLTAADSDGRISSYAVSHEFEAWDMWSRKYVLLGMQYFLEICNDDELKAQIVASMRAQLDYIIARIGREEDGKKPITSATRNWRGLNSSSILEPVVRLYSITEDARYLDFAKYIVDCGGTSIQNIFEIAFKDELYPYQYAMTKAYEMTSCFEGLLEYYRVTKNEHYKTAVVNFANKVLESDFTVIGCAGCSHELFDHSSVRQASTINPSDCMQETCVTVTLMKFFYQLHLITGEAKFADAFERSFYNAYLGAFNTEDQVGEAFAKKFLSDAIVEPMPFDSYSPLTSGVRGVAIGGTRIMSDKHHYGCCAAIGSAGIGLASKIHVLTTDSGIVMNLYTSSKITTTSPAGNKLVLTTDTDYPISGDIKLSLELEHDEKFELKLRIPEWSKKNELYVCGESYETESGYTSIKRTWKSGDTVSLKLDMRTEAIYPIPYGEQIVMTNVDGQYDYAIPTFDREDPMAKHHIALRRGPLMLAQDARLGYDLAEPVQINVGADGYVDATLSSAPVAPYDNIIEVEVPLSNGKSMHLTDYSSAGRIYNDSARLAVWLLTK